MQIDTIGFAGLLGAGSANAATAATGDSLGQAFGLLLGAPSTPAGAGMTPPLAVNDSIAPAAPTASTPNLSVAQLLTTAAPLATMAGAGPATAAPDAQPAAAEPAADALPAIAETPLAAATPRLPGTPADVPPPVDAKPGQPARPDVSTKPAPGLPADPAAPAPAIAAQAAEPVAEQPVADGKTPAPVKRGPRLAGSEEELPAADPAVIPDNAPAVGMVAVAMAPQVPVRPELAAKPQPSPTRQIGEVTGTARKADAGRAEPSAAMPAAAGDRAQAAVSALAGKAGDKNDNAPSDERGQAPAFTLRGDTHAAPAHAATETGRTQAAPAVAATEPVVAARPGHLGQTLGVEIARKVEAGEDTLRVRLSPDNLGKVEVTLSFDDGGKLHATVRAESAHALDLLRQDAPDLARTLDQAGIRADAQSFRFESRSEGGGAHAQQHHGQNNSGAQLAGNDEPDTTEAAYREIRGDGQVDLLA